jgi:hypothetical protein
MTLRLARLRANQTVMHRFVRLSRGLFLVVSALAVTLSLSGCGGMTVPYEGAHGPKKARADIPVYDIDCRDPVQSPADCTFNGGPLQWQSIGLFRVPSKAIGKWSTYRSKVQDVAAQQGCTAVALRKFAPAHTDGNAIGAFCVDPAAHATGGNGGAPATGGVGISVSASATIQTIECNQPSDCPPGLKCTRGTCAP